MEAGGEVMEVRERVAVGGGGQVEAAVIAARAPGAIRFRDKVEGRSPGAVGAADDTGRLKFGKFCFGLLEAVRVKAAGLRENRQAGGVDVMENTMGG